MSRSHYFLDYDLRYVVRRTVRRNKTYSNIRVHRTVRRNKTYNVHEQANIGTTQKIPSLFVHGITNHKSLNEEHQRGTMTLFSILGAAIRKRQHASTRRRSIRKANGRKAQSLVEETVKSEGGVFLSVYTVPTDDNSSSSADSDTVTSSPSSKP